MAKENYSIGIGIPFGPVKTAPCRCPEPGCDAVVKYRDVRLRPDEAATLLHVNRRQLYRLIDAGMPKYGRYADSHFVWPEIRDWYENYRIAEAQRGRGRCAHCSHVM